MKHIKHLVMLATLTLASISHSEDINRYNKKYLHQLLSLSEKTEPGYFTYSGKIRLWFLGIADKAGISLSKESLNEMRKHIAFQAELIAADLHKESKGDSLTEFNARIQALIGANIVVPEKRD